MMRSLYAGVSGLQNHQTRMDVIGNNISNVNTIIVHDADRFGLSQLYQLRGRVGRSDRTAYAFLMYRKDKILAEIAENRLKAIREFSDLGSGIRIAMRDLEIRGAGNVLGAEQSGHMEAVGYELYCKLLNEAVSLLKGEYVLGDYDTTIEGKELGKVENVLRTGSNDVYQTRRTDGGELLIPALKAVVKEIDVPGGRMVVDMPEEISDAH